jgi:Uma2 family endonuclease
MAIAIKDDHYWTREEYERRISEGFFHPEERLELVDGVLYEMTPQSSYHLSGLRLAERFLKTLFTQGFDIRTQGPLALGLDSEPEPDVAVVPGKLEDYFSAHPTTAVLIVEVADSSLLHDRKRKKRLYARAGIPEYWLVNLVDGSLEVYRAPEDGVYTQSLILRGEDTVSPLERPEGSIRVADLLPFRRG